MRIFTEVYQFDTKYAMNIYVKDKWYLRKTSSKNSLRRTEVFLILDHFLHSYIPNKEKRLGNIIILHMYTINDNHMMKGSWDRECGGWNFLSFRTIFCPFTPQNNQKKLKFWKNKNYTWRYYHFTHVYHKSHSYDVWFLRYGAWRIIFFSFMPLKPRKIKILKNWKTRLKIPGFYTNIPKIMSICYNLPGIQWTTVAILAFHFGLRLTFYTGSNPKKGKI